MWIFRLRSFQAMSLPSPISLLLNHIRLIHFFNTKWPLVFLITLNQIIQTNIFIAQTLITTFIKSEVRIQIIWTSCLQKYDSFLLISRFANLLPVLLLIFIIFNLELLYLNIPLISTHPEPTIIPITRTSPGIDTSIQAIAFAFPFFV